MVFSIPTSLLEILAVASVFEFLSAGINSYGFPEYDLGGIVDWTFVQGLNAKER